MKQRPQDPGRPILAEMELSDQDVLRAMKELPGYLDITTGDFREIYHLALRHAQDRLAVSLTARDIMSSPAVYVTAESSLQDVARLMAEAKVTGAPVVEGPGKVVGVLSERDFLAAMGGKKVDSFMGVAANCLGTTNCLAMPMKKKTAADLMTAPAVTAREKDSLAAMTDLMARHGINRLPVVDDHDTLLGIVTRTDVVKGLAQGTQA